jgi:hypothetical protein
MEHLPGWQRAQSEMNPPGETEPASHGVHSVAPDAFEYLPTPQARHAVAPDANEPDDDA